MAMLTFFVLSDALYRKIPGYYIKTGHGYFIPHSFTVGTD